MPSAVSTQATYGESLECTACDLALFDIHSVWLLYNSVRRVKDIYFLSAVAKITVSATTLPQNT